MPRSIRVTVWGIVSLAALYTLLAVTVGVSLVRPVPLNNDPLTNSIAITSVSSNRITLAGGRVLRMRGYTPEKLRQALRDSGDRIELESSEARFTEVYVRRKKVICGGTHGARVIIPLVPSGYAAYERSSLGPAEFR